MFDIVLVSKLLRSVFFFMKSSPKFRGGSSSIQALLMLVTLIEIIAVAKRNQARTAPTKDKKKPEPRYEYSEVYEVMEEAG